MDAGDLPFEQRGRIERRRLRSRWRESGSRPPTTPSPYMSRRSNATLWDPSARRGIPWCVEDLNPVEWAEFEWIRGTRFVHERMTRGTGAQSPVSWGCAPPNPLASIPPERGLTPNGDAKKCETPIDYEQPLHGYPADRRRLGPCGCHRLPHLNATLTRWATRPRVSLAPQSVAFPTRWLLECVSLHRWPGRLITCHGVSTVPSSGRRVFRNWRISPPCSQSRRALSQS